MRKTIAILGLLCISLTLSATEVSNAATESNEQAEVIYDSGFIYSGWSTGGTIDREVLKTSAMLNAMGYSNTCKSIVEFPRGVKITCTGVRYQK